MRKREQKQKQKEDENMHKQRLSIDTLRSFKTSKRSKCEEKTVLTQATRATKRIEITDQNQPKRPRQSIADTSLFRDGSRLSETPNDAPVVPQSCDVTTLQVKGESGLEQQK